MSFWNHIKFHSVLNSQVLRVTRKLPKLKFIFWNQALLTDWYCSPSLCLQRQEHKDKWNIYQSRDLKIGLQPVGRLPEYSACSKYTPNFLLH